MSDEGFDFGLTRVPGPMPVWRGEADARQWRAACERVREQGGRLVALWGAEDAGGRAGFSVYVALANAKGLIVLSLSADGGVFPDVSDLYPAANRMQRAVRDMLGLRAEAAADARQWLRHAAWGEDEFPLRRDFVSRQPSAVSRNGQCDEYAFVRVEGEAVHEIPVGPVHAGTIEPGHFRFSVVGEGVLRLEERLGYKHKGIEKRFEAMSLAEGARLAGRVSGDSTVAYAWAYAMAVESAAGILPPGRAQWLRALLLERERVGQHLWDLGFLGNDAGLAFGLAQFSRLREDLLRASAAVFGHRYLMDTVIPGGVSRDLTPEDMRRLRDEMAWLEREVKTLKSIYDEHAGLQDRFIGCGRIPPRLADRLGLTGSAGRASGQAWDLRAQFPCLPYNELDVVMSTHRNGDVAARVTVRFEEIFESLRISRLILERLPFGELAAAVPVPPAGSFGVGWVEGWRGEVLVALETGENGAIARCHPHDPSWQNWPVLEYAVIGNIVPDFPLINKSFNLSYSGHDL